VAAGEAVFWGQVLHTKSMQG